MKKSEQLKEVRNKLKSLSEQEKAQLQASIGVVTIEGRVLSPYNTMLVAVQNPKATVVGGYRQWQNANRQVMKGESGIAIWIPSTKKSENADDEVNFYTATVFDISQTQEMEVEK
jgi:hypothetical protein